MERWERITCRPPPVHAHSDRVGRPRPLPQPGRGILVLSERESLGDGFYKLHFLRALKRAYPDEAITWIVSESDSPYRTVMSRIVAPYVARVVPHARIQRPKRTAIANLRALPPCSLAIDNRSLCSRVLEARIFLSADVYQAPAAGYLFCTHRPRTLRPMHKLARLLDMLQAVTGCAVDGSGDIPLSATSLREAEEALPHGPIYVGLVPGATDPSHRWPLERYVELGRWIERQGWQPVVLLGPLEREMLPRLRRELPAALFPGCTATETLRDVELSLAISRRLHAAVVNDTGSGHLVAASGTPVLSLFGRSDPRRWSPVGDHVRVLWSRRYGGPEIERIPSEDVIAGLAEIVSEAQAPTPSRLRASRAPDDARRFASNSNRVIDESNRAASDASRAVSESGKPSSQTSSCSSTR
jgi:ADP-heptose:LPS heptosyltransferase